MSVSAVLEADRIGEALASSLPLTLEMVERLERSGIGGYSQYQSDPVGFGQDVLGDTYTEDVQKLIISVRDYPITLARSANATGKTHCAARIAVWWYLCYPDAQVYTAAAPPEGNLRLLLWGEIGGIVARHPQLFTSHRVQDLHISRSPQSFLTGVTIPATGTPAQREARFSGKHAAHLLFILDEGDAIPEDVYRGIESCMSGGMARLLVLYNPRSASGPVYQMERDQRAKVVVLSAFRHPNVVQGADIIPAAVTREKTVRRIHLWARPLALKEHPDSECFELPEYLVGASAIREDGRQYRPLQPGWYKITEPALSYMVLGEYPSQSVHQLISRAWIEAATCRWQAYVSQFGEIPPTGVSPVLGLDVAEYGSDANVCCPRYAGYVARLLSWGGIDVLSTGDRAASIYRELRASAINADATGVGSGVPPHLQRAGCNAVAVKVASSPTIRTEMAEFGILRDQLWWACREWLRVDPGAMLPPDSPLAEELAVATYEVRNGKLKIMAKPVMRELLRRSPDRADALCLTFMPAVTSAYFGQVHQAQAFQEQDIRRGTLDFPTAEERRASPGLMPESVLFHEGVGGDWYILDLPSEFQEYVLAVKTMADEAVAQPEDEKNFWNVIEIFARSKGQKDKNKAKGLIQVAEYRSRLVPGLLVEEVYKAYLAYGKPVIFPQVTAYDHGTPLIERLKLKCPVFRMEVLDEYTRKVTKKPGWYVDRDVSKRMIDTLHDYLREGKIEIRSRMLASELSTYGQKGAYTDLVRCAALAVQAGIRVSRKSDFRVIPTYSSAARG